MKLIRVRTFVDDGRTGAARWMSLLDLCFADLQHRLSCRQQDSTLGVQRFIRWKISIKMMRRSLAFVAV
jgi:hypothetical protein